MSDPNTFLQGATEILTATMISCWIITLIFNPQVIDDNPLKDRLGYNDFCVGWDVMPASIVGSIGTFLYTMHMQRVHPSVVIMSMSMLAFKGLYQGTLCLGNFVLLLYKH